MVKVNEIRAALFHARSASCGKCVPCRIGLFQLENLLCTLRDNPSSSPRAVFLLASTIRDSADCAIGYEAANGVLRALEQKKLQGEEKEAASFAPPCVALCPAHVDIPGYIALTSLGRGADAVRLIRKDNPFPATCALICEHPCEADCRRSLTDSPLNIRAIKRYAVEQSGVSVKVPARAAATGKRVAVLGAGPAGLTAAYFLALMGHDAAVYERRANTGGMLRYGIPSYRLPRETLQWDIDAILSVPGITLNTKAEPEAADLLKTHDALFVAIGAHGEKSLGVEGEKMRGVISAAALLREVSPMEKNKTGPFNFASREVLVVGGGNVAMDAARTAVRLGAASVSIVYRRRKEDMTALPSEVEGAVSEGCQLLTMLAPVKIEGKDDQVTALVVQPQLPGPIQDGRPKPVNAKAAPVSLRCDIIIVAIGQAVEKNAALKTVSPLLFTGGDCVTGPSTVIKAIAAGKKAARDIDTALGFSHPVRAEVEVPHPALQNKPPQGRVESGERLPLERKTDFEGLELCMSDEEAFRECGRCLRCDKTGYGLFRGGRVEQW